MPHFTQALPAPLRDYWRILTDIPGWPDAPLGRRLLRVTPLLLPLLLIAGIMLWRLALVAPDHKRQLDAFSPLIGLESEVVQLRETASSSVTQADPAPLAPLLNSAHEATPFLEALRAKIASYGWKFNYTLGEPSDPASETPLLRALPVRAKLTPITFSGSSFDQLLRILSLLSQQDKRLDLMRLALRADDKGSFHADLHFRLTLIVPETTASR